MTRPSRLHRVAMLAPLLVAVPVLIGIAVSILRLRGAAYPSGIWSTATNASATAVYLGDAVYQDPAKGFSGGVFPPALAFVSAALHHVHFWPAWPIVLTIGGSLALVGLAARLAYRPLGPGRADRATAIAVALGFGGLAWWLVSSLRVDFLLDGRVDHPSWALALIGLVLVPRGATTSWRSCAGAVLLITAGIWTKQTAVVAAAAAIGWVGAGALYGSVDLRKGAALVAGLLVLNGGLYVLAEALTGGWFKVFTVDIVRAQPITSTRAAVLDEFWRRMVIPAGTVAVLAAVAAALGRRGGTREPGDLALATIIGAFVALALAGALYARGNVRHSNLPLHRHEKLDG